MHPILSDFRRFLWHVALWFIVGVAVAKLLAFTGFSAPLYAGLLAIPLSIVFGFLTTSAYYISRSFQTPHYAFFTIALIFSVSSLISGFLSLSLTYLWNWLLEYITAPPVASAMTSHLNVLIVAVCFFLYFLALLTYDMVIASDNIKAAEKREANARLHARDAEMQVLRSQIDPHFLFNSLNSISALTAIDPIAAREMTIALADFFRKTLVLSEQEKVSLEQELSLCEDFLAVEKIRFGKKLQTNIQLDDLLKAAQIPPMILQPLLENAIKHGIRTIGEGGCITIHMTKNADWLYIRMSNPINPEVTPASGSGLGLHNLKARFQALYHDQARVEWKLSEKMFVVELTLPLELQNHV